MQLLRKYLIITAIAISLLPISALAENMETKKPFEVYSADAVEHVLLAEVAVSRNKPKIAVKHYVLAAELIKDPKLAQIATEISLETLLEKEAIKAGTLWAELAPKSLEAQFIAATLIVNESHKKTVTYLGNALAISPQEFPDHIQTISSQLPATSGKKLYKALNSLLTQQPQNPYLLTAAAYLAIDAGEISEVKINTENALNIKPDLTPAIELKAKLIRHESKNDKLALNYLESKVKTYPKDYRLRAFLASALIDNNQLQQAINHLKVATNSEKYAGEAFFSLSEIYVLQNNYNESISSLKKAIKYESVKDKANYMLGQLFEINNEPDIALNHYLEVKSGMLHVPSQLKAVEIYRSKGENEFALDTIQDTSAISLVEQKQLLLIELEILIEMQRFEKGLGLVNQALKVLPNDIDFLFMRSILAKNLYQYELAEKDLNKILKSHPDNARALSLMGQTLIKQTGRQQDAISYLTKANKLLPNDPATLDSIGWALFSMGKINEALEWLEKAYGISEDPQIALHLSHVLGATGKEERAISILNKALKKSPELESLQNLRQQLLIDDKKLEKAR